MAEHLDDPAPPKPAPIELLTMPFQRFLRAEASGGIILLVCTVVALVVANTGLWEAYHHLLDETYINVGIPGVYFIELSIHHFINDWLMAIFFFVVGLEIKRELLVGELASPKKAALPIAAALGGMVVPALIYFSLNTGDAEAVRGWGVPMATDIAFAVGVIALLGSRVPIGLKVFLTALAIVDDLGAVAVIALFYTDDLAVTALGVGFGGLALAVAANMLGVRSPYVYLAIGGVVWAGFLESGVHATIAGVLMAFTIPATTKINEDQFATKIEYMLGRFKSAQGNADHIVNNAVEQAAIGGIEKACEQVQPPLIRLEHGLVKWVAFVVMPVFALANAGVHLGESFLAALSSSVALGVALGLVFGKTFGVLLFTWVAYKLKLGNLPRGSNWTQVTGVAMLAGIGFTMSLFVAGLAFPVGSEMLVDAKVGILAGSFIAGIAGVTLLYFGSKTASPAATGTNALQRPVREGLAADGEPLAREQHAA